SARPWRPSSRSRSPASGPRSCSARRSGWGGTRDGDRPGRKPSSRWARAPRSSCSSHREKKPMGVKTLKPTSAGRRFMTLLTFDEITKTSPEKRLVVTKKRTGGRNAQGRITTRHIGGGHKRKLRLVDFRRDKLGIPARVAAIEYDPNRSARLALLFYRDGEKR